MPLDATVGHVKIQIYIYNGILRVRHLADRERLAITTAGIAKSCAQELLDARMLSIIHNLLTQFFECSSVASNPSPDAGQCNSTLNSDELISSQGQCASTPDVVPSPDLPPPENPESFDVWNEEQDPFGHMWSGLDDQQDHPCNHFSGSLPMFDFCFFQLLISGTSCKRVWHASCVPTCPLTYITSGIQNLDVACRCNLCNASDGSQGLSLSSHDHLHCMISYLILLTLTQ